MPFKLKLIKQFQKNLRLINTRLNKEPPPLPSTEKDISSKIKQKPRQRKKFVYCNFNCYQLIIRLEPLGNRKIANFYNIIGINEAAVRGEEGEDSYFRTLFYIKNIKKIQIREKYLLLNLSQSFLEFPPIDYILQRYQSFGDAKFSRLAGVMREVSFRLRSIQHLQTKQTQEDSTDIIDRYTETLSNKIYVFRTSNHKVIVSKSMLQLLEIDYQDFALETIKFRAPLYEPASTERYFDVIVKYFENMRNLLDLVSDRISLEAFLDGSLIRFKDYFYTKRNKKIYCKVKVGMPHPLINIFEIEEVISKSDEFQTNKNFSEQRKKHIQKVEQNIYKNNIKTMRPLTRLPKNLLPQNIHKVANYYESTSQNENDQEVKLSDI